MAVQRLKELNQATKAKATAGAAAVATSSPAKTKSEVNDNSVSSTVKEEEGALLNKETQPEEADTQNESKDGEPFTVESVNDNNLLLEVPTGEEKSESNAPKEFVEVPLTDEEARIWRRRFVAACR